MDSRPALSLSVVIPAYNESSRMVPTLEKVLAFLQTHAGSYELLVVDDGSTDQTVPLVEAFCRQAGGVRLLRNRENSGKGVAVRGGILSARSEYILFTDADLSAPIAEAERLLPYLEAGYDIVIGSRAMKPEWITPRQPWYRQRAGQIFNLCIRALTGLPFRDTQCGFKLFRREAARAIFTAQRISGFGFDVETLYLARKFGLRSLEVPVHWGHSPSSKVRLLRDSARMFIDLLRIRWNDWRGRYSPSSAEAKFENIAPQ